MSENSGKFQNWLVGIMGAIIASGVVVVGGVLWSGNSDIVKLRTEVSILSTNFDNLSNRIAAAAASAYSSSDAARDRADILGLIRQVNDVLGKHDEKINSLNEYRIRQEESTKRR